MFSLLSGKYLEVDEPGQRRGRYLTLCSSIKKLSKVVLFYIPICGGREFQLFHIQSLVKLSWCPWCPWCPHEDSKHLPFLSFPSFLPQLLSAP